MRADKLVPFAVVKEQFLLHQGETWGWETKLLGKIALIPA